MTDELCHTDPLQWIDLSGNTPAYTPAHGPGGPTVVALGNFDGLHIAHRQLICTAVDMAKQLSAGAGQLSASSAVFTFRSVKKDRLTDFSEKIGGLAKLCVDYAAVADFGRLRDLSPEDFFRKILLDNMNAKALVCGYNFRFGRGAVGDTETLRKLCEAHSVALRILPPVTTPEGTLVSSTAIRAAVKEGRAESAAEMLGRPFTLTGEIAHGRTVGRRNDCPTLNLALPEGMVIPKFGVYFTKCRLSDGVFPSISNVGVRPTFNDRFGESEILCEVHLLGDLSALKQDELYGSPMAVELDHFCRPERKFSSPEALYEQIARDIAEASRYYQID